MWIKLDDGFATHPKILAAGPNALVVQVRALCYARRHHTDGFIPSEAVALFVSDLPACPDGWANYMMACRLWEADNQGYNTGYKVHDFLDWNMSKKDYELMKKSLSEAGKKGMKHRWNKGPRERNQPYNKGYNKTITQQSISTDTLNSLNSPNQKSSSHSKKANGRLLEIPLPDDWVPKESHQKLAGARQLDLSLEAASFRGKAKELDWRQKDWDLKFTNFMLQELKWQHQRRHP